MVWIAGGYLLVLQSLASVVFIDDNSQFYLYEREKKKKKKNHMFGNKGIIFVLYS